MHGTTVNSPVEFSSYLIDTTKTLHQQYTNLMQHAENASGENELGMTDAMAHRMMDSRDIRTKIPREFFRYDSYDSISMRIHVGMLSANAVFGRDASVLQSHLKAIGGSIATRTAAYRNYVNIALGRTVSDEQRDPIKLSKGQREKVINTISQQTDMNPAEAKKYFQRLEEAMGANRPLDQVRDNLKSYFSGQEGPFKDFKLMYELLGTHSYLMLNQPKSGILNLLSLRSFPSVLKGANEMSVKATWGSVLEVANQTLGGIVESLGIQAWQTSEYGEYLNDMFFRTSGEDLDLQDYMLNTGVGCLLYTSPRKRDVEESRMQSSA